MKTYRIFLASSAELAHERDLATAAIADFVSLHPEHNANFKVVKWENFAATFEDARKQNQYNDSIPTCDVFLMLFWTKVGRYTKEEYDLAQKSMTETKKPLLCLLEKQDATPKEDSVAEFKKQVPHGNGLFSATFKNDNDLKSGIKEELQKLFKDGFLKKGEPATLLSPNGAANPNVFIGREDELKEIRKRLDNCGKLMLINAEGGIGKTTLAAKYWNESLHDYKHNAWLFCENGIINALKELAPKLNLDLAGMDEAQQLNALKHALSGVHDEFLLVLDNANDDEDIRVFRQTFEGFHWHVLITSRCQGVLDKEQELPITHLPPPLAKALFEKYYKEDSPDFDALLDRLLEAIRYHTLLIEIFAKNMCESAELGIKMADFLQKLESEGLHLGKHSFEITTDYTIAVRANATYTDQILDALYDFGKLSEDQRFLLVNLAFLPAEPYTLQFINILLANDSNRTDLDLRKTLKSLSKKGWIAQTDYTYRLSPVVQDLLLHKNKETLGTDAQALLDRLNYIFENDGYNLLNIKLPAAEPYAKLISQLNKSLEAYPSWDIGNLNFRVGVYFNNVGYLAGEKNAYTQYRNIYQKLLEKEPNNLDYKHDLAISYEKLGGIYEATGDWKNALLNYQEDFRITKEIYESSPENLSYKNGLAISYSKLGGIYEATGDWKNALSNYQECNRIIKEIYESSPENLSYKNGLAISYERLGGIYEQTGDFQHALLNYQERNRIIKEIYESSPENLYYKNGLAISYERLGGIYKQTGDWKNALSNYQECNRIIKEIYESSPENLYYKYGLAISYERLGGIYQVTGDWKNALSNYQECNRLSNETVKSSPENLSYNNELAISYQHIGRIYEQTGDWKNALLNYQEYNRLEKEIVESSPKNVEYQYNLGLSLLFLGRTKYNLQGLSQAKPFFEESYAIFQRLYAQSQSPKYYVKLKELESTLQMSKNGCFTIIMPIMKLFMKIPYFKRKVFELQKQAANQFEDEYRQQNQS